MTYALIRRARPAVPLMSLEAFAHATSSHPDLIRRLVALGVIEARKDRVGELWFSPREVSAFARVQRLRATFALNYATVGLVTDLLDRIAVLQAALRAAQRPGARGEERLIHGPVSPYPQVPGGLARRPVRGAAVRPR